MSINPIKIIRANLFKKRKFLKIAQIAPLWLPIPPKTYGGIELMLYSLIEELTARKYDLTLFASGDSATRAKLVPLVGQSIWLQENMRNPHAPIIQSIKEISSRFGKFDIIHNHFNFFPLPLTLIDDCPPFLTTVHRPVSFEYAEVMRAYPKSAFCAISQDHKKSMEDYDIPVAGVVYNGIDVKRYTFNNNPENYFLYLGRLNKEKGVITAIKVAERAGVKIIVAGNVVGAKESLFFVHELQPFLNKDNVQFVGQVDFDKKIELLKNAKGLLFPIDRREPFGLVMIEAMACGAPVIAFNKGSVPEVVEHGKTGFIVNTEEEMIESMGRVGEIDRRACRKRVEEKFTLTRMVSEYETIYKNILNEE